MFCLCFITRSHMPSPSYHTQALLTLSKWSSKIQAVAPSVLLSSSRNTFSRINHRPQTAVQLIDEILADHPKLLARSQVLRSSSTNTAVNDDREKEEIFDDIDFYQQMLRDVIDTRGNGFGAGGDEWMSIQKQKKASKKKVDTKASKGRKLRSSFTFLPLG
jgi:protein AATF/BFR2